MAKTLLQLRTGVRRFIDESSAGTFSDADINQYVNDAELSLWMDMCEVDPSFGLREATIALVQAQVDYLYPSDILGRNIQSLHVYTSSSTPWRRVEFGAYEQVFQQGNQQKSPPDIYCAMDGYLKVGPPPASDASDWTMRLAYTRKPTAMSGDSDTMDSDDAFAELIMIGAAIRCLERTSADTSALETRRAKAINEALGATDPSETRFARQAWTYK